MSSKTKIPSGLAKVWAMTRSVALEDLLVVPGALVDELLEGLLGVLGVARSSAGRVTRREGFDALALAVVEQALEIDAAPGRWAVVGEVVAEDVGIIPEPVEDFGRQFGCVGLAHTVHTNKATERFRMI